MKTTIPIMAFLLITAPRLLAQAWYPLGADDRNWASQEDNVYQSMAVSASGDVYVAYFDIMRPVNRITVRTYSGGAWSDVGPRGFTTDNPTNVDMAVSMTGAVYVVYRDDANGGRATVKTFDGSAWVSLGAPGFSTGQIGATSIAVDAVGTPILAYVDYANASKLTVMAYTNGSWNPVGTVGFTPNAADLPSLAINANGDPTVAFRDAATLKACVMRFTGTAWAVVGSMGFSAGDVDYCCLAISAAGEPHVGFSDGSISQRATVMKFNGTNWVTVGSAGFSSDAARNLDIGFTSTGEVMVGFREPPAANSVASVMRYDGATWTSLGAQGFSAYGTNKIHVAIGPGGMPCAAFGAYFTGWYYPTCVKVFTGSGWSDIGESGFGDGWGHSGRLATSGSGELFLAYVDLGQGSRISVRKFVAGSWTLVGSAGFSAGAASRPSIALNGMGEPYVAFEDYGNSGRITVMKYNGSNWATIGSAGFTASSASYPSIALSSAGEPYVAFSDLAAGGELSVVRWDGSAWMFVGPQGFSIQSVSSVDMEISPSGDPYVTAIEYSGGSAGYYTRVWRYSSSTWSNPGGFPGYILVSSSPTTYPRLAFNAAGVPYVAYCDPSNGGKAAVSKLDAGYWGSLGAASPGGATHTSIAINSAGEPLVAFRDESSCIGHVTVMKYAASAWGAIGASCFGGRTGYSQDIAVMPSGAPVVSYACGSMYAWRYDPALSLSTGAVSGSPYCGGASVSVPYTVAGTYDGGNTFTAQLSNPAGAFAPPMDIGSVNATTSGSITATIPASAQAGSAYRIRVVSSSPALYGSDNGSDLTVISSDPASLTWTGATSSAWNTVGNWDNPCAVPDDGDAVTIPTGTTPPSAVPAMTLGALTLDNAAGLALGGDVTVTGALTLSSGALSVGAHTLTLNGVIAQTGGSLTGGASSKLTVGGSSASLTLPGVTLHTLAVDRPNGIDLAGDVTIGTLLALNEGVVSLGAHSITLGSSASISGGGASSFLFTGGTGVLTQQGLGSGGRFSSVLFPVGPTATVYTPVALTNEWTDDAFSVRVSPGVFLGGGGGTQLFEHVVGLTWHVAEATAGGSNVHLVVQWNAGDELAGFNRDACALVRHDGSAWGHTGFLEAAGGSGPWTQIAWSNRALSPFIVADADAALGIAGRFRGGPGAGYAMADAPPAPLPVELRSFTASVADRSHVRLRWTTATETDNHGFFPERAASHAGAPWLPLGFVQGAGSSAEPRHYEFVDALPQPARDGEVVRYRLRQVDRGGGERAHPAVDVRFGALPAEPRLEAPYPDPCSSSATIAFTLPAPGRVTLSIADARGAEILRLIDGGALEAGAHACAVRTDGLGAGLYFARLLAPGGARVQRFVVVR